MGGTPIPPNLITLLFFTVILLVVGVMALLMPFFIYRIRNEVISINRKIGLLVNDAVENKMERKCSKCGARNRAADFNCASCGAPLL